jgi:hypothetical protein
MKEVNESLYKFKSEFEKERVKIKQLRHSFFVVIKLINSELINSLDKSNFTIDKISKFLSDK